MGQLDGFVFHVFGSFRKCWHLYQRIKKTKWHEIKGVFVRGWDWTWIYHVYPGVPKSWGLWVCRVQSTGAGVRVLSRQCRAGGQRLSDHNGPGLHLCRHERCTFFCKISIALSQYLKAKVGVFCFSKVTIYQKFNISYVDFFQWKNIKKEKAQSGYDRLRLSRILAWHSFKDKRHDTFHFIVHWVLFTYFRIVSNGLVYTWLWYSYSTSLPISFIIMSSTCWFV